MTNDIKTQRMNLALGALVADAAALGLHWIYDQDHIRTRAPSQPEFREPNAADYAGVPGYFAHATRHAGNPSQYGEQLLVMMRALLQSDGQYDAQIYTATFRAHFGYGGEYVGYIDHATRDTLDNFRRAEDGAQLKAEAIPFDGEAMVTRAMVTKALALRTQFHGTTLREKFEEAVRITHNDERVVAHGFAVLDQILATPPASGAYDQQLPAISKLPPLVALLANSRDDDIFNEAVDSAVRTTNDHPRSIAFGRVCAHMMRAAATTGSLDAVKAVARAQATTETDALLGEALARLETDNLTVTRHFGMACDLSFGVPSALHNILTAPSFSEGVRRNIYAGGDSCGRAILVGSVLGAIHGVGGDKGIPSEWINKLSHKDALLDGMKRLLA